MTRSWVELDSVHLTLRTLIAAPKSGIRIGSWHNGKVPRADFPIARKAYGLGASFEWCIISLQPLGAEVRVLVIFHAGKQKYEAIFGVMSTNGARILCSYQYHPGEPGWHCHATCDDATQIPAGIFRGPWVSRIPRPNQPHRRNVFGINDRERAVRFAQDVYGIFQKGDLL